MSLRWITVFLDFPGPGWQPEHGHLSRRDRLDADEDAHQRRLPAVARPEQPGDLAAGNGEGQGPRNICQPFLSVPAAEQAR